MPIILDGLENDYQKTVAIRMSEMSEWEQHKFLRLCIFLKNGSARAARLADMCVKGQITRQKMLELI